MSTTDKSQAAAVTSEDWKRSTCKVSFEDKHQDLVWVVIKNGVIVDCNLQHWLWVGTKVLQQPTLGHPLHFLREEVFPESGEESSFPACTRYAINKVETWHEPIRPYPVEWLEKHQRAARGLALAVLGVEVGVAS